MTEPQKKAPSITTDDATKAFLVLHLAILNELKKKKLIDGNSLAKTIAGARPRKIETPGMGTLLDFFEEEARRGASDNEVDDEQHK